MPRDGLISHEWQPTRWQNKMGWWGGWGCDGFKWKCTSWKCSSKNVLIPTLMNCKQYSFKTAFSSNTVSFEAEQRWRVSHTSGKVQAANSCFVMVKITEDGSAWVSYRLSQKKKTCMMKKPFSFSSDGHKFGWFFSVRWLVGSNSWLGYFWIGESEHIQGISKAYGCVFHEWCRRETAVESRLYVRVRTQKLGRRTERDVQVKIIFRITPCEVIWTRLYQLDIQTSGTYDWETYNWDSTVLCWHGVTHPLGVQRPPGQRLQPSSASSSL